jgi:hypothetical protein
VSFSIDGYLNVMGAHLSLLSRVEQQGEVHG